MELSTKRQQNLYNAIAEQVMDLRIKIKRDAKASIIIFILFLILMFGIDKLRINKR